MSEEKKASISELKLAPRYATEMMINRAEQLEELAAKLRKGIVPAVAVAWVEEVTGADVEVYRGYSYESRLPSLIGGLAIVTSILTHDAAYGSEERDL